MFLTVVRLEFEEILDPKDAQALNQSILKQYKASSRSNQGEVVVTFLAAHENDANKKADDLASHCEQKGFGRIIDERIFCGHIDEIFEEEDDEESDEFN